MATTLYGVLKPPIEPISKMWIRIQGKARSGEKIENKWLNSFGDNLFNYLHSAFVQKCLKK